MTGFNRDSNLLRSDSEEISLLKELIEECSSLADRDYAGLINLQGKIKLFIISYVSDNSEKLIELEKIQFFPRLTRALESIEDAYNREWQNGKERLIVFLNTIYSELSFTSKINNRRQKAINWEEKHHLEMYDSIGRLISDNQVEKALEELTWWCQKIERLDLKNSITILSSRYQQMKIMEIKGLVSFSEITIEQIKIKEAILQLAKTKT